jgi:hypothetical protein
MERREGFVRKGFLATLAQGVCMVLIVALICVTALGGFLVFETSRGVGGVLRAGTGVLANLPETLPQLRQNLPAALADALSDVRAPDYRPKIEIESRLIRVGERARLAVTLTNTGEETVSLLAARVNLLNDAGEPVAEISTYFATPIMIEDEWRGPLLPGSTRHCVLPLWRDLACARAEVEISDLRLWRPVEPKAEATASLVKSD